MPQKCGPENRLPVLGVLIRVPAFMAIYRIKGLQRQWALKLKVLFDSGIKVKMFCIDLPIV